MVATQKTFKNLYTKYMPLIAPIALVVLQALISNNIIHLSVPTLNIVDVVFAALGIHSLHLRTK
jgi:hypothetical protein